MKTQNRITRHKEKITIKINVVKSNNVVKFELDSPACLQPVLDTRSLIGKIRSGRAVLKRMLVPAGHFLL